MTSKSGEDWAHRSGSQDSSAEEEVRGWLADLRPPVPRLQADSLLAAARGRARRRRRFATAGTAVAAAAALLAAPPLVQGWRDGLVGPVAGPPPAGETATPSPTAAPVPVECAATVLSPPDDLAEHGVRDPAAARVTAMDPTGRYQVGDTYGSRNNSPAVVLWRDTEPERIAIDAHHLTPYAVNSQGAVVGTGTRTEDGEWFGWLYRDGETTVLPLPAGFTRVIHEIDINESGDVVGNVQNDDFHGEVVVWPASAVDEPRILPAPEGEDVVAVAITDHGTVVGWFAGSTGGYRWDAAGNGAELPLPDGAESGIVTGARADWAVGSADFPASDEELAARGTPGVADADRELRVEATVSAPVRWDLATGAVEVLPGYQDDPSVPLHGGGMGARGVNAAGDAVVGYPNPQVLYADQRPVALAVPVAEAAADPVALSDEGTLVAGNVRADNWGDIGLDAPAGSGTGPDEPSDLPRPVLWRC